MPSGFGSGADGRQQPCAPKTGVLSNRKLMSMTAKEAERLERRIPVREVMTRDPITVSPRMRINHAASLMKEKEVSSLIVIRKDMPIGIVTEKDIVEKAVAMNAKPSHITIKDIMSSPLLTVQPNTDIAEAARTMASLKIRRLVVVEDSKLVGILTESDILRISPALIELTREFESIHRDRDKIKEMPMLMGICESCQSFSEELKEHDGLHVCKFCIEDSEQE